MSIFRQAERSPLSFKCPLLSLQTAQPSFPTPPQQKKKKKVLLLWERQSRGEMEGVCTWRSSASNLCQSMGERREQMISIFSLASGSTISSLNTKDTWRSKKTMQKPSIKSSCKKQKQKTARVHKHNSVSSFLVARATGHLSSVSLRAFTFSLHVPFPPPDDLLL